MSKKKELTKLVNLMCISLRHKIGSIVNENEFYANKYAKDSEILMKEAEKILIKQNWSKEDKTEIKKRLSEELKKELEKRTFINNKKFEIMDEEIKKALEEFELL